MKVREIIVKSVLTKSNLPGVDLVINPYIGCVHSCQYCYADFMRKFTGHIGEEWGDFVDVKTNAAETINPYKIPRNALILFGSVTDPYQPIESKYEITKKCLEKLLKVQPNLEILTKSPLILRDIELLKKFKNLRVGISIGILDEKFSRELEPGTASPLRRIEVLKKLHEAGIKTYLFVSPIFPEISDIPSLLDSAEGYFDEVFFENLNIRANNRGRILNFIKRNKSELIDLYRGLQENREYWNKVENEIIGECKKRRLKFKMFFHHGKVSR